VAATQAVFRATASVRRCEKIRDEAPSRELLILDMFRQGAAVCPIDFFTPS
jgi:hypothetical protein